MYYWNAITRNGSIYQETSDEEQSRTLWNQIKSSVISLKLVNDAGFSIELPPHRDSYAQGKGASSDLNGNNFKIESHWISCSIEGKTLKIRAYADKPQITYELK